LQSFIDRYLRADVAGIAYNLDISNLSG